MRLVERGSHQLRGLRRPETVYALTTHSDVVERVGSPIRFRILGALSVDGEPITSPQLALLLTRLLVDRNQTVLDQQLIEAAWGATASSDMLSSLQSKISRMRSSIGPRCITRVVDGYRLAVGDDELDAGRFEGLLAAARAASSPGAALGYLDDLLALWHGAPYDEWGDAESRADAARLEAGDARSRISTSNAPARFTCPSRCSERASVCWNEILSARRPGLRDSERWRAAEGVWKHYERFTSIGAGLPRRRAWHLPRN